MASPLTVESTLMTRLSLRDPAGTVYEVDNRIIREVKSHALHHLNRTLSSHAVSRFVRSGSLISTTMLNAADPTNANECVFLEHEKVPFRSFPYEWAPRMLFEAARLTLDLAEELLTEGMGLKDATPYNILFRGTAPVFVDILSIEQRHPLDATWLPFAQFVRTFLIPLAMHRHLAIPLDMLFLTHRDGVDPDEAYPMCGFRRWFPPFFNLVCVPFWLSRWQNTSQAKSLRNVKSPKMAAFILRSLFKHLRKHLEHLHPGAPRFSRWLGYASNTPYAAGQFQQKKSFIETVLREIRPKQVLDIGCNTGFFAELAAVSGAAVVAVDSDPAVVDSLWAKAREAKLDLLPLVINMARPSPSVGWNNQECPSFLERARGRFDAVFLLALVHHLMIQEAISLEEILKMAVPLSPYLVIEYIGHRDESFQSILRGRDENEYPTRECFESTCEAYFKVQRRASIEGSDRCLYLLKRKNPT